MMSKLIHGLRRPSLDTAVRLSRVLGMTVEEFHEFLLEQSRKYKQAETETETETEME